MARWFIIPLLIASHALAQMEQPPSSRTEIPTGTPLWVKSDRAVPLRIGTPVTARLMYPVYTDDRLVLPEGTVVQGTISGLAAERQRRIEARLRGDFTQFSKPVVQFHNLIVSGAPVMLPVGPAGDGSPVLRLVPPPPRKGGFIRQQIDDGIAMAKDRLRLITAPGKKDRLEQLLYSQLPYHPQRVEAGTVWTVDTTAAVDLPAGAFAELTAAAPGTSAPVAGAPGSGTWTVQAYLSETLSSAQARKGQAVNAVVAQPVLDSTGAVAVPQGAVLKGEITRARPARRFGRAGELRFDFRELTFPGKAQAQEVQTNLAGIDAAGGANLALDREGQVQPKPKDKLVVPFILLTLAGRPLDRDRGDNAFGKDAVSSNSLGVLGFIIGTAGGWRNVAAGIGYYGSAIAIWNRWIKRGEETTLRRDTRIVVQTTARNSTPLRAPQGGVPSAASH